MLRSFMGTHIISGYDSRDGSMCTHWSEFSQQHIKDCYELKKAILSSHESSQRGEDVQDFLFIVWLK